MTKDIRILVRESEEYLKAYQKSYPHLFEDKETAKAILFSHLAYLINKETPNDQRPERP